MRFLSALLVGLCLVSVPVFADTADPPTTSFVADDVAITASGAAPAVASAPVVIVDDGTLVTGTIRELLDVATNAKAVGVVLAVVLAIAALLKLLTKHGAFARLLERTGKTWVRPLLSAASGAVTALAATLSSGIRDPLSIGAAIVSGILVGLGASGYVDAARVTLFPDARTKESVDAGATVAAAEALAEAVRRRQGYDDAFAKEAHGRIIKTLDLPPAKRVEALAALLRKGAA